ncbi:NAD(P)/FAD-dependent oxidoreductase [Candidatus Woesearchaeota archaeon]|nr:NAD(P)/FAD-dependent oxidoreductase [Candidatus Woesearchaeota archaeon]
MKMKDNEKVLIIGAGPIGCYCGYLLAKKGFDVEIYEEHKEIGKPIGCTGIVTKKIKKYIKLKNEFLINKIGCAKVCCENKSLKIKLKEYVIDRCKFDKYVANLAIKKGVKIFLNHKIIDVKKQEIIIKDLNKSNKIKKSNKNIRNNKNNITKDIIIKKIKNYKHIIGADGPQSIIAKKINSRNSKLNIKYYIGKQAVVKGKFDKNKFIVHLGKISPNFFGWVVPENNETARIGVAVLKDPNNYFGRYLDYLKLREKDIKIKKIGEIQSGLIPIYSPKHKIYSKKGKNRLTNYYIVGDAALQVKATTGGGIIPGFRAAKALAKSIINNTSYEKELFKTKIELKAHLMLRKTLNKFSDKNYKELIDLMKNPKIKRVIEKYDRDSGIKLISKLLLKEPRLIKFAFKIIF